MASEPWEALGGPSTLGPFSARPLRSVEAQHLISTRKLVDSDEEQRVLEDLIEGSKPPKPERTRKGDLHYLLYTPFRYPPLRWGSRFGTRFESGIWYGSAELRTALAETAYYRLLFLEGSAAVLAPLELELSVFRVRVRTRRGVDLTLPPFDAHEQKLSHKARYETGQALGRAMRAAGVEAFRYRSARDVERGRNIGLFTPRALAESRPSDIETWRCTVERARVEFSKKSYFERKALHFLREQFLIDGHLPAPSP